MNETGAEKLDVDGNQSVCSEKPLSTALFWDDQLNS